MRTLTLLVCLVGAATFSKWNADQAQEAPAMNQEKGTVRFVKSDTLPPSPGYSQAVEIRRGARFIYVAGQVAMDRSGKLVGEGDFKTQAKQTFENLRAALQASGASFDNVVK